MSLAFIHKLTAFGNRPNDSTTEKLNHSLLIYLGLAMSIGGIIWGSICLSYGLQLQAVIPLGYAVLTVINFIFFAITKLFGFARFFQVLISVLLPFVFQWSLGGFVPSGAVMLWAMISLISMITVQSTAHNIWWLFLYTVLTIISGLFNEKLNQYGLGSVDIPPTLTTIFFVLNISIISIFAVGLNIYFVKRDEKAQIELIESEKKFKAIVEYIGKAIINIDQYGTILYANEAICELFGYQDGELAGQNVNHIIREQRRSQNNPLMYEDEQYIYYLLKIAKKHVGKHQNGTLIPIKLELTTMNIADGEKMYVGVINGTT